jgi:hypothetical protein
VARDGSVPSSNTNGDGVGDEFLDGQDVAI